MTLAAPFSWLLRGAGSQTLPTGGWVIAGTRWPVGSPHEPRGGESGRQPPGGPALASSLPVTSATLRPTPSTHVLSENKEQGTEFISIHPSPCPASAAPTTSENAVRVPGCVEIGGATPAACSRPSSEAGSPGPGWSQMEGPPAERKGCLTNSHGLPRSSLSLSLPGLLPDPLGTRVPNRHREHPECSGSPHGP